MKKPNLILLIFILILSFLGCKEKKEVEPEEKETAELTIKTADYAIVKTEDQSRKALGKKSLSQYQKSELEKLPTNKKLLYRIVLSKDVKENQVKPTVEKIISKLTTDDSDIDEIILWLYSDNEISNSTFDIGSAIWAPNGQLGNIDANIAKNNNRNGYKIDYQIKKNLDQYLTQKSETGDKLGFSEEERKQIFKDIVKAEDKANEYEQSEQDKVFDKFGTINDNNREKVKAEYNKISNQAQKLMNEYKSTVYKKYNITEEQLKKIGREGQDKYWPLE